jgi:hypothetical protein
MSNNKKNKKPLKHRSAIAEFMLFNLGGGAMRDRRKRRQKARKHDYRNPQNW